MGGGICSVTSGLTHIIIIVIIIIIVVITTTIIRKAQNI